MDIMQTHILPGFYNTFKAVPMSNYQQNGVLGVAAIGMVMDWGKDDEPTELLSEDLITGASQRKIGYTISNTESILPYMLTLISAPRAYFVKMNKNGVKASVTVGDIKIEAKYKGIFGNNLSVVITENTPSTGKYTIVVNISGVRRESFVVSNVDELLAVNSNYVVFSTEEASPTITATTGATLINGTNGTVDTTSYQAFKDELKYKQFNVCAIMLTNDTANQTVIDFVNNQVKVKNKLVTGIVYNKPMLNDRNIISVEQGIECDDFTITTELNIPFVASLRAGCPLNESLTDLNLTELVGARKIINPINDDDDVELENAVAQGRFVYRYINDGSVRIVQDINTLVNFTTDEPKGYRKNRHIAIIDYLVNEEQRIAHDGVIGKYSNTEEKRTNVKARFINIFKELFDMGAIREYDPLTDLILNMGDETDKVNVNQVVKPTDSIEIFNVTTNVDFNVEV